MCFVRSLVGFCNITGQFCKVRGGFCMVTDGFCRVKGGCRSPVGFARSWGLQGHGSVVFQGAGAVMPFELLNSIQFNYFLILNFSSSFFCASLF